MYHKLGRPKRTVKAQIISIQEPGCDPIFYRINDRGNIVDNFSGSKQISLQKKAIPANENNNSNQKSENKVTITNNCSPSEKNNENDENESIKLIDINYFLNKKPFPSINDFDIDNLILPDPFLLVS